GTVAGRRRTQLLAVVDVGNPLTRDGLARTGKISACADGIGAGRSPGRSLATSLLVGSNTLEARSRLCDARCRNGGAGVFLDPQPADSRQIYPGRIQRGAPGNSHRLAGAGTTTRGLAHYLVRQLQLGILSDVWSTVAACPVSRQSRRDPVPAGAPQLANIYRE